MADRDIRSEAKQAAPSFVSYAKAWGDSPAPPAITATLIAAQALRPVRVVPLLFPPALLFSTYINLNGYTTEAAGTTAAWSGLYLLLANRRSHSLSQRFSPRGVIRGATMGLCAVNILSGGLAYVFGKPSSTDDEAS